MARLSSGEGLALLKRPLKFKRGDKGPFIVDIQAMFAKLGFDPGEPEGVFMAKTEDAVRVFQAEYGLPVTGIIDAKTLKFLYEEADPEGYPAVLIEGEETGDSNEIAKDEETAAGEKAIAGEESKSADGLMDEQGLAENQEFISAQGPTGNHGLIEGHEPADDKGGADDQDLVDHLGSVEGQGSSPDKEIAGDEQPVATPAEVRPDITTMATGASDHAIVISLSDRALGLYQGNQLIRRYPVAIGKPSTPTPVGTHKVLEKVLYPGGGLGTRWIGFTYQMHGIHGTNRPELIGQEVSNGCVRMHNANVEELYEMVGVGTPVVVIVAPVQSWSGLGKPTSQTGAGSGQAGTGSGQAKKPGGLLDPSSPPPKDPTGTSEKPGPTGGVSPGSAQGRTYTIQPGDSIWAIARRFGTTVEAIVRINGIRNPELIYPGEVLKIP